MISTNCLKKFTEVEVLSLEFKNIGDDGARALSMVLMNENNKVTVLILA